MFFIISRRNQFWDTILKKFTNKSLCKLNIKVVRDRKGIYLSFDILRPKFDLILWPAGVNLSNQFDHN